jgi:hypothetical protein
MAPIKKLFRKIEIFEWIIECSTIWKDIKNQFIQITILISRNWELEFHVHIDACQLAIGAILA